MVTAPSLSRCGANETMNRISIPGPTHTLLALSTIACVVCILAIFGFLLYFFLPLLATGNWSKLVSWEWQPFHGQFGILPMLAGSIGLSLSAMVLAYPLGIGISLFVNGIGPSFPARLVRSAITFAAGIPTVVYGFVAAFSLVPVIRASAAYGTGFSWLAASLMLSVLVLPTIVLILNGYLENMRHRLELTCLSLGMDRSQALSRITLPSAKNGLYAAGALGFGRAVGDTLISLMLAGNAAQNPSSLLDSIRTLTAHIALVVSTDSQSLAYQSVFASGLILLFLSLAVNLVLYRIKHRAPTGG